MSLPQKQAIPFPYPWSDNVPSPIPGLMSLPQKLFPSPIPGLMSLPQKLFPSPIPGQMSLPQKQAIPFPYPWSDVSSTETSYSLPLSLVRCLFHRNKLFPSPIPGQMSLPQKQTIPIPYPWSDNVLTRRINVLFPRFSQQTHTSSLWAASTCRNMAAYSPKHGPILLLSCTYSLVVTTVLDGVYIFVLPVQRPDHLWHKCPCVSIWKFLHYRDKSD